MPMMTAQLMVPLGYSPTLEARICELPLQARRLINIFKTLQSAIPFDSYFNLCRMSMFLILPDSLNPGIQSMEANMTTDTIKALMTTLQVTSLKNMFISDIISCLSFLTLFHLLKLDNTMDQN